MFVGFEADFQAFAGFVLHRIEGVAQQVDQHLFQANRIAAHPGRTGQVQYGADLFVAQPGVEQLQRLVHHCRQVQAFAQTAGAFAGEGFQVAGEGGHAREHFIHRFERFVGVVDPAVVEQQAQGRQLHALGGEWLVYFMGQGRGHLPQRREFGRLHQTLLGGAQVAGAFFYQSFEFFATALTQFGQAPALIEEQQQEHQGQP
ncbi:hypothetical protein D3C72_999510 [compost metagenome]